jgi:hypothetical protein
VAAYATRIGAASVTDQMVWVLIASIAVALIVYTAILLTSRSAAAQLVRAESETLRRKFRSLK